MHNYRRTTIQGEMVTFWNFIKNRVYYIYMYIARRKCENSRFSWITFRSSDKRISFYARDIHACPIYFIFVGTHTKQKQKNCVFHHCLDVGRNEEKKRGVAMEKIQYVWNVRFVREICEETDSGKEIAETNADEQLIKSISSFVSTWYY